MASLEASQVRKQEHLYSCGLGSESSVADATQVFQNETDTLLVPGKFSGHVAHHERLKRIRSGDHGEEIRQEGNLRRTCSICFAHFLIMKFGAGAGEDPFAKVKDLITDLTKRLQAEVSSEASHTWHCDGELSGNHREEAGSGIRC